jgi:hypothetical protein
LIETDEAVHFDETSLRVEQSNHWVHSAGTERATNYHLDKKRGTIGSDHADILPKRTGKSVHDDWAAYYTYQNADHVSCNAITCANSPFCRNAIHKTGKAQW